jgi:recombination associated protein RdgC
MFKNLIVYRIGSHWQASAAQLEAGLAKAPFVECAATQPMSLGWVPPRGAAHGALVETVAGQWLMQLRIERRLLPASVVKRRTDEQVARIEQTSGRKPGKKQTKEIKEDVILSLLPQAFTKDVEVQVWLNPAQRLLMVSSGSVTQADAVVTELVRVLDDLALAPLHTAQSPAAAMSQWLTDGEPPAAFSVDRECELKAADDTQAVVRYARHPLDIEEVRGHIAAGKQPTQLALTWKGRVSVLLTHTMQIKRIAFLDSVFDGSDAKRDDAFDANAAIATGELAPLLADLVLALGGEQLPGAESLAA